MAVALGWSDTEKGHESMTEGLREHQRGSCWIDEECLVGQDQGTHRKARQRGKRCTSEGTSLVSIFRCSGVREKGTDRCLLLPARFEQVSSAGQTRCEVGNEREREMIHGLFSK